MDAKIQAVLDAARAFLPDDGNVFEDADSGESYRHCCFANYRYYPHKTTNKHADDCPAVKLQNAFDELGQARTTGQTLSLADIRNGTGFAPGARFIMVEPE
jgi:hypothetical protein